MNPIPYQSMAAQQWNPQFPPNPPPSTTFWTHVNLQHRLKDFHETLILANTMQKELELLLKVKEAKGYLQNEENVDGLGEGSNLVEARRVGFGQESKGSLRNGENVDGLDEISNFFEGNRVEFGAQELISVEAANEVMSKLRFLLEPFRVVTDEGTPWEEKSATVRLNDKINKSKRNKQWRKRKRQHVAEKIAKERVQFDKLDQEADEWRAREIAKDIAQRKVEKMKEIAKQKAKEERKKLEAELELALMVEKLQELRSIRIQKLKRQGHFLPEEDDKFLEKVRAAVEEEERQAKAAADTDAAKDAIAAAEESRKVTQLVDPDPKDESIDDVRNEDQEVKTQSETSLGSETIAQKQPEKQEYEGQSYGAYDYVASLPPEFYHYYHGSNTDMGTLIEVRRTWDSYIRPGGSRIPCHWVQAPPPTHEIWASYLVERN